MQMHTQDMTFWFLLYMFVIMAYAEADLASDRGALLLLRSSVGGRTLLWNASSPSPCSWAGVTCEQNRVTALRLPGVALSGQIPPGIFGNLTQLRTLSLRLNSLGGSLPSDLALCNSLRNLYLQGNRFAGHVPDFLFTLQRLVRLNLASNNFSGEITLGFNNLTRLRTLFLENNRLSGSIPSAFDVPNLNQFNVSNNLLNGSIPAKLQTFTVTSFMGNSLCGKPLDSSCSGNGTVPSKPITGQSGSGQEKKNKKLSGGAIAGIVIGSILGFVLIVVLLLFFCRKKSSQKTSSVDIAVLKQQEIEIRGEKSIGEVENTGYGNGYSVAAAAAAAMAGSNGKLGELNGTGAKKLLFFGNAARLFDLEDLLKASAEVLGKGTFGTAYKAVLEFGTVVAVKRLKDVTISEMEFKGKIDTVGAMDHENLIPLRAYYYSRDEKLLVYDYMPMGSLSALLHGNKGAGRTPLNWEIRSGIALGAARGIEYLHSLGSNVSHGNIKSSNILLTKSYDARISDFGLAQLVGPSSTPNRVAGYRAPEVTDPRKVSQKADVYSFGVLLLELLTGKAPSHAVLNDEGVDLPRWVQSIVREEWTSEVFDLELLRYQNVGEEMVQLLQLAIDCAAQYPDKRPSISHVTRRIEELCRSSMRDDQDPQHDLVTDGDEESR
ncbi:Pkinase domain-containing protein/LRR_1 domain-containing protein/LRRNT_2 domain-containing protein/LRR_8 domain-containing protein [Cephalotus follicularis]|uniref:Pkinase domain-containing protein/LRR_1 domain-containing protein/LRRNT_2 domain-containing protein/LRR_8 domain-containing protein n=1 Tax=Cephalotus follicularis TaxID=3775 RepID=A0A1Q3CFB2_CEPFO|nr:Pkinase domain-containing protein/LRR_1 domain-containing protein/LRRNT_2 domain-containing protein/LRR_8 domain-containing protein [Cephalotus follicularis]